MTGSGGQGLPALPILAHGKSPGFHLATPSGKFFPIIGKVAKFFPIIGKNGAFFPTIGNFFSNHWKTCGGAGGRAIVQNPGRDGRRGDGASGPFSCVTHGTPPPSVCPYCRRALVQDAVQRPLAEAMEPPSDEEVAGRRHAPPAARGAGDGDRADRAVPAGLGGVRAAAEHRELFLPAVRFDSHDGTTTIPTSPHDRRDLFFSSPQWLPEKQRYEQYAEFTARIAADHDTALAFFRDQLHTEPLAFFFPKGNYGQFEDNSSVLRDANLAAVAERYPVGFILNQHAYNDARTDRRRLNRLPVDPTWDADTLVRRLENAWPLQARRSRAESLVPPERWIADWGILDAHRSTFTLRARPADDPFRTDADATGGARAWIAGSSSFHEGTFDTRFRLVRGDLSVYLRFKADDDWLRFSLSDTGHAHLSTSAAGGEPQTLATDLLDGIGDLHTTHQLLVSIRDNLFYARLDGRLLFNGPVLLPPATLATPLAAIILAIAFLLQYLDGDRPRPLWNLLNRLPPVLQGVLAALLLTIILGLGPDGVAPFIYFQF